MPKHVALNYPICKKRCDWRLLYPSLELSCRAHRTGTRPEVQPAACSDRMNGKPHNSNEQSLRTFTTRQWW